MSAPATTSLSRQARRARSAKKGVAITAVVLGIVALAGSPMPIVNNATIIAGFIGVVFGIVGLFGLHRVMAGAGVVLTIAGIAIGLALQAQWAAELDTIDRQLNQGMTTAAAPAPPRAADTATATPVTARIVPTELVGKTLGEAKKRLADLGFTHVIVAGGDVTDADHVVSLPLAGKTVALTDQVTLIGEPRQTSAPQEPRTAPTAGYQCRDGDEALYPVCAGHKAWVDGQVEVANCQNSGGTWDIASQSCTDPQGDAPVSPDVLHSSDPGYRDANGDTLEQACARMGYSVTNCPAG